jgi:hypothetical protein
MLKLPIYIYETGYTVYSDLDVTVSQGYAPMYQKNLVVYKGITNTLKFTVKNQDQKPISVNNTAFKFIMNNPETGASYLHKTMSVLDDGSTRATRGVVQVVLSESDLISINSKFYSFSIIQTVNGVDKPVYTNTYHDAEGVLEVQDKVYSPFTESEVITSFSPNTRSDNSGITDYTSSWINANPEWKRANSIHTVSYTTTGYKGTIKLQATLDLQPTNGTSWVDVSSVPLNGYSGTNYVNVSGVYSWIRIQHTPDSSNTGTVDKISIRS